jgi:hypothetical protein
MHVHSNKLYENNHITKERTYVELSTHTHTHTHTYIPGKQPSKATESSMESMFAAAGCTRDGKVVELKGDFVLVGCLKTEKMATPYTHLSDGTCIECLFMPIVCIHVLC